MVDKTLAPAASGYAGIGTASPRIEGRQKVTGDARYGSDFAGGQSPAYAYLATSAIARGRITQLDETAARAVPGVLDILTYKTVGSRVQPGKMAMNKGYMGSTIAPLASSEISHAGQIVAVVVADSFEAAREGAQRLKISYAEEAPSATFGSHGTQEVAVASLTVGGKPGSEKEPKVGDAEGAFAKAEIKIDERYATPTQHHNPIELFTTTCSWSNGMLTVWESTQNVYGFQNGLAEQLGIEPWRVHIISPFVGGAFGSRGSMTQRTALIALAAERVRRPVMLEASRSQGFTIATYRAETQHRVRLAAGRDGKLQALIHDGWEVTSRPDNYMVAGTSTTTRVYACPNIASSVTLVHADRNTPGFMRAPPEVPYMFALESAMDELAVALKMDPIELRRVNDTMKEPIKGLPYTSRSLMPCFDTAAKAFGWSRRNPAPGSMSDGDWLIGWGCATTLYPTMVAPATVRVTLTPNGHVKVQTATHEIGTGVMTALALTAAGELGVPLQQITVEIGNSDLPPSPVAGGSNSTASLCNVVAKACREIKDRLARAAVGAPDGPLHGLDAAKLSLANGMLMLPGGVGEKIEMAASRASNGAIEVYAENIPHDGKADGIKALYKGQTEQMGGEDMKDRIQFAFGAQFVEVRVHRRTAEIRAPRVVSAFAAGKIVNPTTARSQLMGGQIWGISAALLEATELDTRTARYYNNDLAEYLIPVNADIDEVQTILVPEVDTQVNPLGIKGIGELGNVGMNAAVANAVFHATGVRVRELPVRIEKLLGAPVPI
jgi:xanthine dehydrogenase YagR molybdenum-binding subunit